MSITDIANISKTVDKLYTTVGKMSGEVTKLSSVLQKMTNETVVVNQGVDPFIFAITVFVLACFVGYFVVWRVTPALHTPLMAVTNAISGIIVVGAIIAVGQKSFGGAQFFGFIAVIIASINIFGGFVVTYRMLEMFRKK
jgi:proton-translocating NAD(P)+ transhydrogenase subunit alpha